MSKQAMTLALEALEAWHIQDLDEQQADTAISALKEAINQQDAETVARIVRNSSGQIYLVSSDGEYFDMSKFIWKLLYPTPQQPKESQC